MIICDTNVKINLVGINYLKVAVTYKYKKKIKPIFKVYFVEVFKCHLKLEQKFNNMQTWLKKTKNVDETRRFKPVT